MEIHRSLFRRRDKKRQLCPCQLGRTQRDAGFRRFEVGNHTYELHQVSNRKGTASWKAKPMNSTATSFSPTLAPVKQRDRAGAGTQAMVFAYPFGNLSKTTDDILKEMGFQIVPTLRGKGEHPFSRNVPERGVDPAQAVLTGRAVLAARECLQNGKTNSG